MQDSEIVTFWSNEIKRAENVRRYHEPRWRKARRNYENRFWKQSKKKDEKDYIERPNFYSNVETAVSNLAANPPAILVTAQKNIYDISAQLIQPALKYYTNTNDIHFLIQGFVKDVCIFNIAVAKVGYNADEKYNLDADSPFISRITPYNYLIDPEANTQRDARWEGEMRFLDWEKDIMSNPDDYINLDKAKELVSEYITNTEINNYNEEMTGDTNKAFGLIQSGSPTITANTVKRLKIYEIYDKIERKIIWLADGKVEIKVMDYPDYIQDSPYCVMTFNKTPDFFYGRTDYDISESLYLELNLLSNRMTEFSRRMIPKYIANKNAFANQKEISDLLRSEMCEIIPIAGNVPPENSIFPIPIVGLPKENVELLQLLTQQLNETTGITEYAKGSASGAKTATEASLMQAGATTRSAFRQRIIDRFVTQMVRKLFFVLKHTVTAPKWISIAGKYPLTKVNEMTGESFIFTDAAGNPILNKQHGFFLTPDLLQADLQIEIEAGSMALANSIQKQQTSLNMYNLLASNPLVNMKELLKEVFKNFNLDADRFIMEQPPQQTNPANPEQISSPVQPNAPSSLNLSEGNISKNAINTAMNAGNNNQL